MITPGPTSSRKRALGVMKTSDTYKRRQAIEAHYLEWLRGERERIALTLGTDSPEFIKINSQLLDIVDAAAKGLLDDN